MAARIGEDATARQLNAFVLLSLCDRFADHGTIALTNDAARSPRVERDEFPESVDDLFSSNSAFDSPPFTRRPINRVEQFQRVEQCWRRGACLERLIDEIFRRLEAET